MPTPGLSSRKHHKAYVDNVNKLIAGTDLEGNPGGDHCRRNKDPAKAGIFNNAAQVWNHSFTGNASSRKEADARGAIADKINAAFGGTTSS